MPPSTGVAVPATAATQKENGISSLIKSAGQGLLIFMAVQFFMSKIMNSNSSGTTTTTTTDSSGAVVTVNSGVIPDFADRPANLEEGGIYNSIPQRVAPIWPSSPLDVVIAISPTFVREPLAQIPSERKVVDEKNFGVGDFSDSRVIDTTFSVPKQVQNNGTLWGHFYIGLTGSNLDPATSGYDPSKAFNFIYPLTQYIAKKKVVKTKNLLAAADDTADDVVEEVPTGPVITSYYHPNFTMSFIPDTGVLAYPTMHPAMRNYLHLEATGARDSSGQNGWYYPVLFINTFWQLKTHMMELNSTVTELPLHIDLNNLANWKYSIMASIDEGAKNAARQAASGQPMPGGGDGSEFEMLKEILIDTNPYLLGTTVIVSILHMIFEMLAFKSDISHWRNKKDNVGISVRSIFGNVFMQTVIFLYLLDNNENTSWMILFSQGMGIVLELWKITKTVDVRIRPAGPDALIPYRVAFEDKHKLSETEEKTKYYDAVAFKYLYVIAVPLLLAYAGYSLVYETHKSWYSFTIATLVGSVYAYGFLMMVPSLYINYRLKSVAHMPAKAMTYKFLNTFIDDLFAFTIKMPTLHRLATLRDDVIFFVYLYQSWKYKIDYSRVNEFGQGGGDDDDDEIVEVVGGKAAPKTTDPAKVAKALKTAADGGDAAEEAVGWEGIDKSELSGTTATKASGSAKNGGALKRK